MKTKIKILSVLFGALLAAASARATLYTETFTVSQAIPDGNPVGVTFSGSVGDVPSAMTVGGLTVGLNISGGYNGDLYAYLVAPNGTLVVLLNQPGTSPSNPFGYGGAGMNVTLADGGSGGNINTAAETDGVQMTGTYSAQGSLAGINGSAADGTWRLFFADESSGGGTSTLNGWSLGITAVPEPITWALIIFGAGSLLLIIVRWCWCQLFEVCLSRAAPKTADVATQKPDAPPCRKTGKHIA